MAVEVQFEGYVNDVLQFDWGTVYKVSHKQVIRNELGDWETTGYDNFDVSREKGLPEIPKGSRVKVEGRLKTRLFDKKDGSGKGIALNVRANVFEQVSGAPPKAAQPVLESVWPEVAELPKDNAPF